MTNIALSPQAESLLEEIIDLQKLPKPDYWKKRFDKLSFDEDVRLRSVFRELHNCRFIDTRWADNIPYTIQVFNDGYNYIESKKTTSNNDDDIIEMGEEKQQVDISDDELENEVLSVLYKERGSKKNLNRERIRKLLAVRVNQNKLEWHLGNLRDNKLIRTRRLDSYKGFDGKTHQGELVYEITAEGIQRLNSFSTTKDNSEKHEETDIMQINTTPIIFLSHKSDNKKYADALERLITSLGVKRDQLIYTSHPLHKIPLDRNIYDFLRENINNKVFVIILWSNEYLNSPACLCEMGAAWVAQSDYTNIYIPNFNFKNPKYHECPLDTRKMGAVLNGDSHCKAAMIELKNKILSLFSLDIDEQTWTYILDQFIEDIKPPFELAIP